MLILFTLTSTRWLRQGETNSTMVENPLRAETLTFGTPSIFSPSVTVVVVHRIIAGKALKTVWKWSGFESIKIQ